MMRGQRSVATVVRRPNGELVSHVEPLSELFTSRFRRIPFARGVITLLETLIIGIKTLLYSANISLEEEEAKISGASVWALLAVTLAISIAIFFVLPLLLTGLIDYYFDLSTFIFHLIEGMVRLSIFVCYLKLMTLMPDIRRLFAYHGAEHKTINAYESGEPLEVEAIKKSSTAHLRCGTSFAFTVLVVAVLVFSLIGRESLWLMILSRIVLIPAVSALSYEIIYISGRHADNKIVRMVLYPGLLLQKLTTRNPDEGQIETAITALKAVMVKDGLGESIAEPVSP